MISRSRSFIKGFEKIAAPAWFYEMNKTMNKGKPKNFSSIGLKNIKAAKGLK